MQRNNALSILTAPFKRRTSVPPALFLIPLLTDFSGMLLIFTVSRNLAELDVGLLKMGLIGAGHAATASLSSFVFGTLSDRIGRKKLIIPGIILLLMSSTVCLIVPFGRGVFLSMYWLSALSLGMIHPATIAWINRGEEKTNHSRSVSGNLIRFCIAWNLGVLSSQFFGGKLFTIGPEIPLFCAAILALANLIVVIVLSRTATDESRAAPDGDRIAEETPVAAEPHIDSHASGIDISSTFVRLSWLANIGGAFSVSTILHLFPQLAVSLGVPADQHGTILALMRVMVICVYLVLHSTRFWQYRFGANLTVQACAIAGLISIYFAQSPVHLYFGVLGIAILIGFDYFSGIYYGNTGHGDEKRGFASGMHEASLGLGIAAGSAAGGVLGEVIGDRVPYLLAIGVLLVLTCAQMALFIKRRGLLSTRR